MDRTSFRPHRKLLALGAIAVALLSASTAWVPEVLGGAGPELEPRRVRRLVAERDAADLITAFDTAGLVGTRFLHHRAVSDRAEIAARYGVQAEATTTLHRARARALASADGLVDDELARRAEHHLDRYLTASAIAFPLDELHRIDAEEAARRMLTLGDAYEETHSALRHLLAGLRAATDADADALAAGLRDDRRRALAGAVASLTLVLAATGLLTRRTRRFERDLARAEASRRRQRRREDFEGRLHRGLEMAQEEGDVLLLLGPALTEAAGPFGAELLLADSGRAHFRRALTGTEERGCAVTSPEDCPAAERGQGLVFASSRAVDSCPHLKGRAGGDCSAACVPVSVGGNTDGVVHAWGPEDGPPGADAVRDLEVVARRAGERITAIRAFARSEAQASTDPLTGLLNRRSLEDRVRELHDRGVPYSVAFGDLDHFKALNDVHGHETGDRALRLFAAVLRDGVRPGDVAARYGGEEFVVVLPDCDADSAAAVMRRVRERLAAALGDGTVPTFTSSFGVARHRSGGSFEETLAAADEALLSAKRTGRDRVLVAEAP